MRLLSLILSLLPYAFLSSPALSQSRDDILPLALDIAQACEISLSDRVKSSGVAPEGAVLGRFGDELFLGRHFSFYWNDAALLWPDDTKKAKVTCSGDAISRRIELITISKPGGTSGVTDIIVDELISSAATPYEGDMLRIEFDAASKEGHF